jgi:hypothetical protein
MPVLFAVVVHDQPGPASPRPEPGGEGIGRIAPDTLVAENKDGAEVPASVFVNHIVVYPTFAFGPVATVLATEIPHAPNTRSVAWLVVHTVVSSLAVHADVLPPVNPLAESTAPVVPLASYHSIEVARLPAFSVTTNESVPLEVVVQINAAPVGVEVNCSEATMIEQLPFVRVILTG